MIQIYFVHSLAQKFEHLVLLYVYWMDDHSARLSSTGNGIPDSFLLLYWTEKPVLKTDDPHKKQQ